MDESIQACFAELDVAAGASAEEIKTAYLDLVKIWHPDRFSGEPERLRRKVENKLKAINLAYEQIRTGADVFRSKPASAAGAQPEPAASGLRPISFGSRWGYVDGGGRLSIKPRFQEAHPFSEGLALVRENGRCGFINAGGEYEIYPEFLSARSFRGRLAAVAITERWGYIDHGNQFRVHPLYEECGDFSEGLAAVLWRGRWGYIDQEGAFRVKPAYEEARPFVGGRGGVRLGDRWGYVVATGESFFETAGAEIGG